MTLEQLVQNAIDESKATNSIVHISKTEIQQANTASQSVREALLEECESNVEANGVEEFLGNDCDGVEWRVHVPVSAYW